MNCGGAVVTCPLEMRAQLRVNNAEDEVGMLHFMIIFSQTVQIKYSYLKQSDALVINLFSL